MPDRTAAEGISDYLATEEQNLRILYQDDAPGVIDSDDADLLGFTMDWVKNAQVELGATIDAEDGEILEAFAGIMNGPDPDDAWETARRQIVTTADPESMWAGYELEDALHGVLEGIASQTSSDRASARDGYAAGYSDRRVILLRVELSGGGPGSYITAEMDPEDRELTDVTYHYTEWGSHAERGLDEGDALYRLISDYADTIVTEDTEEPAGRGYY